MSTTVWKTAGMTGMIGPRTASETVAEQIRGRIATRTLAPGDMLPSERTLLDEFGVARPTMREALRILESDGLVTIVRGVHGGARVSEPDVTTLARRAGLHLQTRGVHLGDLMAAIRVIQPGAVALAAGAATPEQIGDLRAQVGKVAAAEDLGSFTEEATEFLHALLHASGNQTLAFIASLLNRLMRVEARAYVGEHAPEHDPDEQAEFRAWCVEQYAHLVDLIEAGRADEAEAFWRVHLQVMPPSVDDTSALTIYETDPARRA
jgi:DNA-binding FadR family transcriptional regulator